MHKLSICTPSFIDLKPKECNQFPLILVNLFSGLEMLDPISNNVHALDSEKKNDKKEKALICI
jgi:hypothetical protein